MSEMKEPELFDSYAGTYREEVERSIAFAGARLDHFTRLKANHLLDVVSRRLGAPANHTFLDVGCGTGETDRFLVRHVKELTGVDVASDAVRRARLRNPDAYYFDYDGEKIPAKDNAVDVSFAICVMHHVPPARWNGFLAEMVRVTRRGGLVIIFEHNPLNPLTRRAVGNCEFDADAVLLRPARLSKEMKGAGSRPCGQAYVAFIPWGRGKLNFFERRFARIPLGAQYYSASYVE